MLFRSESGDFIQGERVLTSGEGGLFPRGVVVGFVVLASDETRVDLAMASGQLSYVRLKSSNPIPAPEEDEEVAGTELSETLPPEPTQ